MFRSRFVTWTRCESTFHTSTDDTTEGFLSLGSAAESGSATLYAGVTYDENDRLQSGGTSVVYARPNANHAFVGWYVDGEEVVATSGDVYVSANDPGALHLSASALKSEVDATAFFAPTFKVKFNHNRSDDANFTYKTAYKPPDSRLMVVVEDGGQRVPPISDIMASHVGHRFTGWNTAQDGSGTSVADNGDVSGLPYANPGDQVNIWAQWEKCEYTVSASTSGASSQDIELSVSGVLDGVTSTSPNGDDGVSWKSGTVLTITAPSTSGGFAFDSFSVTGVSASASGSSVTFTMPYGNVSVVAAYVERSLSVSAAVDAASAPAVADGAAATFVDYSTGQAFVGSPKYGDRATFTAPSAKSGYSFSGWYVGGALKSTSNPYANVALTDDAAYVAKYKKQIAVGIDTSGGGAGTVSIDGVEYVDGAAASVELGTPVAISATATSGYFGGWEVNGAAAQLDRLDDFVVSGGTDSLTAVFVSSASSFTVTCQSEVNNASSDTLGVAGALSIQSGTGVTDNGDGTYTVSGYRQVTLVATPSTATGARPLYKIVNVTAENADVLVPSPQENGKSYTKEVNVFGDVTFKALWGYKGHSLVSVVSADVEMGDVFVGNVPGVYSDYVVQDTEVVVNARPFNGFKFVGWFVRDSGAQSESAEETLVSTNISYEFTALSDSVSLLARFEPDDCAIFEWEGSDEPMEMEWTSKVYAAARPFDPVAARVDAAGYPVDLTVRTYSSPDKVDALPVRDHELTEADSIPVRSQDGRRLPRMRPERYLQIAVKSTHEVDAVIVGTNMAEVN